MSKCKAWTLHNSCRGQAMVEYVIVCSFVAMILIVPYDGKRLYIWIMMALEGMNLTFANGLSLYAFPL